MKHSIGLFIMGLAVAASVARGQTTYQAWNTPGTYLWLCPLSVTNVQAECWGGGGGGGGLNVTVGHGSGGGGAGGYARKNSIPVTPGNSYMITIPAAAGGGDTSPSSGTNGSPVSFAGDGGIIVTAYGGNGGHVATSGNGAGGAVLTTGGTGGDVYYVGGAGAAGSGGGGGGGSGPSDLANGTNGVTATGFAPGATGSDTAHNGGPGAGFQSSTTKPANDATTPPGGGGGGAYGNGNNKTKVGGAGAVGQIILTWSGSTTASIGTPTCSFVSDSTPPNYNLTTTGSQDWQIYGDTNGYFNLYPIVLKTFGNSINLQLGSYAPPCGVEQTSQRSAQSYTWTGGAPMETGTNIDAENNGFIYTLSLIHI